MQIITFMAFSDMMGSIASAFGFPSGSSLLCPIQSFGNVFFYKASWMWMVMMAYQLWSVANRGKLGLSKLQMHVLCWVVPLVSTLLPLSQVQFGSPLVNSSSWCFFEDDGPAAQAWSLATFFVYLISVMAVMVMLTASIMWSLRNSDLKKSNPSLYLILHRFFLYPLGMIVCWMPNLVVASIVNFTSVDMTDTVIAVNNASEILSTQNGTVSALIYFCCSGEARSRWHHLLFPASARAASRAFDEDDEIMIAYDDDALYVGRESELTAAAAAAGVDQSAASSPPPAGGTNEANLHDGEGHASSKDATELQSTVSPMQANRLSLNVTTSEYDEYLYGCAHQASFHL